MSAKCLTWLLLLAVCLADNTLDATCGTCANGVGECVTYSGGPLNNQEIALIAGETCNSRGLTAAKTTYQFQCGQGTCQNGCQIQETLPNAQINTLCSNTVGGLAITSRLNIAYIASQGANIGQSTYDWCNCPTPTTPTATATPTTTATTVAPATTATPVVPNIIRENVTEVQENDGLSPGEIAAIVFGCLFGALLLGILLYCCCKHCCGKSEEDRRNNQPQQRYEAQSPRVFGPVESERVLVSQKINQPVSTHHAQPVQNVYQSAVSHKVEPPPIYPPNTIHQNVQEVYQPASIYQGQASDRINQAGQSVYVPKAQEVYQQGQVYSSKPAEIYQSAQSQQINLPQETYKPVQSSKAPQISFKY